LRELAREGFIAAVAPEHVGYMGFTMRLKQMYEQTRVAKTRAARRLILLKGDPRPG